MKDIVKIHDMSGTMWRLGVNVADTLRSFKEITKGKHDSLPEQASYRKVGIENVIATTEKMKAQN